jgi:hypothetical protein
MVQSMDIDAYLSRINYTGPRSPTYETLAGVLRAHIVLPQNPSAGCRWLADFPSEADRDLWVHRLANLVLRARRKNSQAGHLDFDEKKSKYFSTKTGIANFALTSKVLGEKNWTLDMLKLR